MPGTNISIGCQNREAVFFKRPAPNIFTLRPDVGGNVVLHLKAARIIFQRDIEASRADESATVDAARRCYAEQAPTAVALFALDAWFDDEELNYQFWSRIFARLTN